MDYFTTDTSKNNPATITVAEISKIHFDGNVIPHQWFEHVKMPSGKTDSIGIILLSEIVYWYRSNHQVDENTGKVKPLQKKFKADMLQTSKAFYEKKFGYTKQQIKDALKRLDDGGYIRREFRTITTEMGMKINNVMYVEPIPSKIMAITHPTIASTEPTKKSIDSPLGFINPTPNSVDSTLGFINPTPDSTDPTNTEITTKITTKTTTNYNPHKKFVENTRPVTRSSSSFSSSKSSSSFCGSNATEQKMKLGFGAIQWTPQQKQEVLVVLEGTTHPQGILNAVNAAQARGAIKTSPMAYLKTLARLDKIGKFNCLDNNNPDNAIQPCRDVLAEQKAAKEKAKDCPICDEHGNIHGSKNGSKSVIGYKGKPFCPHGETALKLADHLRKKGWLLECDMANEADEIVEIAKTAQTAQATQATRTTQTAQATDGKQSIAEIMAKMNAMFNRSKNSNAAADARNEAEQKIQNCEHCNEKGTIVYKRNDGRLHGKACPHDETEIKDLDEAMAEAKYWRTTR